LTKLPGFVQLRNEAFYEILIDQYTMVCPRDAIRIGGLDRGF